MKNISGYLCILILFTILFLFSACNNDSRKKESKILAHIGKKTISEETFRKSVEGRTGDYSNPEKRKQLLDEMVQFEVRYASAVKKGFDKDPKVIEACKRLVVNHFLNENLNPILENITVAENEINTFYQNNIDEFYSPEMLRAAVIKINIPVNTSEEKQAQLLEKANKARVKALELKPDVFSFGSVAVSFSDDRQSRYRGGDTGWIKSQAANTRWEKKVMDTIKAFENPGIISPVIQGEKGFYLVKLIERKERKAKPLAKVRDIIRYRMLNKRKKQAEENFYKKLQQGIKISTDYKALSKIKLPDKNAEQAPPAMPNY